MMDVNRDKLLRLVWLLGDVANDLVFVGGSVVGLLLTDTGSASPRATDDVDVIVEVSSRVEYEQLTRRLEERGLQPDPQGPICRYIYGSMMIDVMPLDEQILGFSNRWYKSAIDSCLTIQLYELNIRVINPPTFIATKLEAYLSRGQNDPIMSHDLEDILMVIDGRPELQNEIESAPIEIKQFLKSELKTLTQTDFFDDLISGTFSSLRGQIVRQRIQSIISGRV